MKALFTAVPGEKVPVWKRALNIGIVLGAVVFLVLLSLKRIDVELNYSFLSSVSYRLQRGFLMTLVISGFSLILSLLLGCISAVCQSSPILPLRYLFAGYVKLIRGTPLLAQIYLFYYIIGTAWGIENRILSGVLILSVFEGAYISEIIRGSFLSLEAQQIEIGRAIGLTRSGILKEIVLPQMFSRTMPALAGQSASIIKDSSLLSVIAVTELSQTMREISALNFRLFECYFLLAFLYLVFTLPLTWFSGWLERRFDFEN